MNNFERMLPQLLENVIARVEEAGQLLLDEWDRAGGPRGAGSSADVDEEIEAQLREGLLGLLEVDFWGEETQPSLTGHPYCWVVDPHDGTSDFLRGLPGTSISVALLHNGVPVLGVVYAPISPDRGRDCIAWAEGLPHLLRNGQPVLRDLRAAQLSKDGLVWVSAAAARKPEVNSELCQPARFIAMPSIAYRLARVAAGDGICAVSLVELSAHDVAAGHALLRGAGGVLLREDGQPLSYADSLDSVSQRCFGGAASVCQALVLRPWEQALRTPSTVARPRGPRRYPAREQMQRAAGCLAGLFIGDNLGAQVEFMSAEEIASRSQQRPLLMEDGGVWNILAGQPTDDGELALALACSLVECQGYCLDDAANAYVAWLDSRPFDLGNTIRRALSGAFRYAQLSTAEACQESASRESQANGALMRVAPIGIAAQGRPALAARLARQDASLTHPHPVCQEANAAYAAAIAVGVAGGTRQDMLVTALAQLSDDEAGSLVRQKLSAAAAGEAVPDFQHSMGWVLTALHNAFLQLMSGRSVMDAITDTAMHGGDTDTNACIAGALVGAVEGIASLDAKLPLTVMSCRAHEDTMMPRPAEYWPEDMVRLAMELCSLSSSLEAVC